MCLGMFILSFICGRYFYKNSVYGIFYTYVIGATPERGWQLLQLVVAPAQWLAFEMLFLIPKNKNLWLWVCKK